MESRSSSKALSSSFPVIFPPVVVDVSDKFDPPRQTNLFSRLPRYLLLPGLGSDVSRRSDSFGVDGGDRGSTATGTGRMGRSDASLPDPHVEALRPRHLDEAHVGPLGKGGMHLESRPQAPEIGVPRESGDEDHALGIAHRQGRNRHRGGSHLQRVVHDLDNFSSRRIGISSGMKEGRPNEER